ncbi:MAG: tetratricopeptide (TPR) repeat protein [Candidatus Omnitrophota bacterium]|jgi:tetratricopeptide (TPR) repeat protein
MTHPIMKISFLVSVLTAGVFMTVDTHATSDINSVMLKQKQVVATTQALCNAIEQNQKLSTNNYFIRREFDRLKSDSLTRNDFYSTNKHPILSDVVGYKTNEIFQLVSTSDRQVKKREIKTLDILTRIDAFAEQDERLRNDAAKAHYNMGNIYFQKGEYEIAAREYYQAVTLMPNDADVHYNFAFVSSRYLNDFQTSLKHFKMYLYLNPRAKDKKFVQRKINEAELKLRSLIDSPLEKSIERSK